MAKKPDWYRIRKWAWMSGKDPAKVYDKFLKGNFTMDGLDPFIDNYELRELDPATYDNAKSFEGAKLAIKLTTGKTIENEE